MTETAPTAPITDADLRAVREAVEKMTPGPWEDDDHESHWSIHGPDGHIADVRCYRSPLTRIPEADANARGIRLLRNHAPGLFARLEAAERDAERLKSEVHECPKCGRACKQCECVEAKVIGLLNEIDHKDARIAELEAALKPLLRHGGPTLRSLTYAAEVLKGAQK